MRWKDSLKHNQTFRQRNGKTPQLIAAHGGDQFMTDSCYKAYDNSRERGMPPTSELVGMQLGMRHQQHHRTPTCVDIAGKPAVAASGS